MSDNSKAKTKNYGMNLPSFSEFADIREIDENFEKIDELIKANETSIENIEIDNEKTLKEHDESENAHGNLQNLFVKLAGGTMTGILNLVAPADNDNSNKGATTAWVRKVFKSCLETVLQAAGLRYSIAQNGYICFGSLFGGLILQWGLTQTGYNLVNSFPISFSEFVYTVQITLSDNFSIRSGPYSSAPAVKDITLTSFTALFISSQGGEMSNSNGRWLAIGF